MKKIYFTILSAMLLVCSCHEDPENGNKVPESSISFITSISQMTRATDFNFDEGDEISLFAVEKNGTNVDGTLKSSGNYAHNQKFTYSNGLFISKGNALYYPDNDNPLFFTAVYPYQSNCSSSFKFEVKKDQRGKGYTQSDLMTATTDATLEEQPELQFYHRLSCIVVNLSIQGKVTDEPRLSFNNVQTSAQIDLNLRSFAGTDSKTSVIASENGMDSYRVILPPQTIPAKTSLITVNIGGNEYSLTINNDIVLKSGRQYTMNLTLTTKKELVFTAVINDWNSGEEIEDIIEPELLDEMEKYIPIYRGKNPPLVEGTYFIDPFETVYCEDEGHGGYDPGTIVNSKYFRLSNQNNKTLTLDYEDTNASGTSYSIGKGSFICGEGSMFTVYFDTEGESQSIYTRTALVISGEKTDSGIKNLKYAFVMVEKGDDPDGKLMDEGVYRVFQDEDGLAVNAIWPSNSNTRATAAYESLFDVCARCK